MVDLIIEDGTNILDRLWQNIINSGARKRRHDSTHLGLILSAIATELNVAISLIKSYSQQFTIQSATDRIVIENLSSLFANRRVSSKSKVLLTFYRLEGYTSTARIPAGFAVRSSESSTIIFKTINEVYLYKGEQSVSVMAYSVNSGSKNNVEAGTLTIFANNQFNGSIAVTNNEPSYGGYDDESIQHLRNRSLGFRYERDATLQDIERQLYQAGILRNKYYAKEFDNDDYGSYLLCIDTNSESAFEDVVSRLKYRKNYGIHANYVKAMKIYVDMYITIKTASNVDYTPHEKNQIYNTINTAVQNFFSVYCSVGTSILINALRASINKSLSNYEIADVIVEIANIEAIDDNRTIFSVKETEIAIPNHIITNIEFVGGAI